MSSFFMRHFGFQPTLWPTLFTVPALVVILALGFWQLQRLQEKLAVIEAFEARVTAPAVAPPRPVRRSQRSNSSVFRQLAVTSSTKRC